MAGKADFTEDEWDALRKGVTGAGMLVSVGHRDFTDSFGEASTLAKYLVNAGESSDNQLVRDLAHGRGTGFGLVTSPKEVEAETLAVLASAIATLGEKAPDDVDAYRALVLGVAVAVAESKGGVAEEETAAIERITAALGATAPE